MSIREMTDGQLTLQISLVRHYLRTGSPANGMDVLGDACGGWEPGAEEIVRFCLALRGNRRTRRDLPTVRAEWRRLQSFHQHPTRWYRELATHVYGMWRQWRKYGFPREDAVGEARLEENLSRASRRQLTYTGALQAELPTLANQAKEAGKELWEKLMGAAAGRVDRQLVL